MKAAIACTFRRPTKYLAIDLFSTKHNTFVVFIHVSKQNIRGFPFITYVSAVASVRLQLRNQDIIVKQDTFCSIIQTPDHSESETKTLKSYTGNKMHLIDYVSKEI